MLSFRTRNQCFTRIFTATQEFYVAFPILTLQALINQIEIEICSGQAPGTVFCKLKVYFQLFLFIDLHANNGLNQIAAALDTYAEMLRLDPTNLVSDTPYNELIFKYQVCNNILGFTYFYSFQTTVFPTAIIFYKW